MVPTANPQFVEDCKHIVPASFGIFIILLEVSVVGSRVAKNEEVLSPTTSSPVFCTLNLVVPDALAERRSPLLVLFMIRAALFPIPPLIERGAGVLVD